jgi:cysteine desulfurase
MKKPIYLDYAATTPVDPEVAELMRYYMVEEFGNAGSRTHEYGTRAKKAVQKSREQIASIAGCQPDEVIFTSGATESNNLAILGLRKHGEKTGKKHIISTAIEHKAVLEPLEHLRDEYGFEVDFIRPDLSGAINPQQVKKRLREDTLLVSVMHVNNETGIIQPIEEVAALLEGSDVYFHVDAAQSFAKLVEPLQNPRIDMFSLSGHKICGPKGIGALITRRRKYRRLPLSPLTFGGGQEFSLRPGTLPVSLIVGLGVAAMKSSKLFKNASLEYNKMAEFIRGHLREYDVEPVGLDKLRLPYFLCLSFNGMDSEAVMLSLKNVLLVSNGSACTSKSYSTSHVLEAMGVEEPNSVIRFSWNYLSWP